MSEHGIFYNMVRTAIHTDRIARNWKLVNERGGSACAVIKSDAYGHGLGEVGRALALAGARDFAVGTVGEGVRLLDELAGLGDVAQDVRVVCLLGAQDREDVREAVRRSMICFSGRRDQLDAMAAEGRRQGRDAQVAVKFDTGMSRLGFSPAEGADIGVFAAGLDGLKVAMAASHLAVADEPDGGEFVHEQLNRFTAACNGLRRSGHAFRATLANSAALLAYPETRLDMQRPGVALYGANPLFGTDAQPLGDGLLPAMDVCAPVLQVHAVRAGETVSYGRTFRAERDMRVAVVGVGYADCYSRGLSGTGYMCVGDARVPVLGRVCMQMTVVDVSSLPEGAVRPGDNAWLLGGPHANAVTAEELAGWWGTITYEAFCLLGLNRREYPAA